MFSQINSACWQNKTTSSFLKNDISRKEATFKERMPFFQCSTLKKNPQPTAQKPPPLGLSGICHIASHAYLVICQNKEVICFSVFVVHAMQAMLFLWHFHRLILQGIKNQPWFFMKLATRIVMNLEQPVNLKDFYFEVECTYVILEATVSSCSLIFLKDSWSSIFAEKFDVTNLFFFPLLLKWKRKWFIIKKIGNRLS